MARRMERFESDDAARAAGRSGWYFWDSPTDDNSKAVCIWCADCKQSGTLVKHSISKDGAVQASIYCCEAAHDFYVLADWPRSLQKLAGQIDVVASLGD